MTKPTMWSAWASRNLVSLSTHSVHSEDSVQTGRICSDWMDAQAELSLLGTRVILLVWSCGGSFVKAIAVSFKFTSELCCDGETDTVGIWW